MKRILTAAALAALALYSIFLAPQPVFAAVALAMAVLCYSEFIAIAKASGVEGPLSLGYVTGIAAMIRPDTLPLSALLLMTLAMRVSNLTKALSFAATGVLGAVYIFLAWRWAIDLRAIDRYWLLYALAINWVGDVAAYYAGRTFGRHKLAPRTSPAKSWEGALASMAAAVAFGYWYAPVTGLHVSTGQIAVLSASANIAGQLGDLAESALKRGGGVKDSGKLLPGHGGFLDRLDSSLFTLPVVYYVVRFLAR